MARLFVVKLRGKVDLLHIHLSDRGSSYRKVVLGRLARLLRVPYVVHLHGAIFSEFWSDAPFPVRRAIDRLFAESNHIVVMGRHWARVIGDHVPSATSKISILPNATPATSNAQEVARDGRVRISCLGQLGKRKGTPQLIEALQRLADRSDWTATIAGDGNVAEVRSRIENLGLNDRVDVPGWLGAAAVEQLLCQTDVLVLPSFAENLPMVILEAFAHGVPVISTPVGAIPEIVKDGRNGLLVEVGDVAALANAITQLLDDTEMRLALGQAAGRDHTEHYELGCYVVKLVDIWRQSCSSSNMKPE